MDVKTKTTLWGAGLAAIGATACCAGPLVLLVLGISGAWIGALTKLEPFRPVFIGVAIVLMSLAYRKLFVASQCGPDSACASPLVAKRQQTIFWIVLVAVTLLATSPWFLPLVL